MIYKIEGKYNQYHEIQSFGTIKAYIDAPSEDEARSKFDSICENNGIIDDDVIPGIIKFELTDDFIDTQESGVVETSEVEVVELEIGKPFF